MQGDVVGKLGIVILWIIVVLLMREAILAGWIDRIIQ